MRTAKLHDITILAANKDKKAIINKLQHYGGLHIEEVTTKHKLFVKDHVQEGLDEISKQLLQLNYIAEHASLDVNYELEHLPSFEEVTAEAELFITSHLPYIKKREEKRKELTERKELLKGRLATLNSIPFAIAQAPKEHKHLLYYGTKSSLFTKTRKKIRFVLKKIKVENTYYYLFTLKEQNIDKLKEVLRKTPFKRIGLSFLTTSSEGEKTLIQQELKNIEEQLIEQKKQISSKLDLERIKLPYLITILENYREQYDISKQFIATKNFFALKGFCEKQELEELKDLLPEATIMATEAKKDAPSKFKDAKVGNNFRIITELFGLPGYRSIDPTPLVAFFYPFFFGFMLSDIGYGLILLLSIIGLRASMGKKFHTAYVIFGLSAISAMIFGLLFGSFFGNLIYVKPLLVDAFSASFGILQASLIIGLVHLNIGAILNTYQLISRKEKLGHVIKKAGGFFLIEITAALFVFQLIIPAIIAAAVLFFVLIKNKGPFGIMDITGFFGTWFSYARLLALSLATAGVALAVNIIAEKAMGLGKLGILLWLIVIIVGHTFNFAINILGCAIHSARLHYVEFFSLFFEGDGKSFKPFTLKKLMEEQLMVEIATGLIAIGAGIAIGFAALGSGIGQGIASSAAAGATAENEKLLAKMLVFAALPETQAIYGFVIAILLLFVFGA